MDLKMDDKLTLQYSSFKTTPLVKYFFKDRLTTKKHVFRFEIEPAREPPAQYTDLQLNGGNLTSYC